MANTKISATEALSYPEETWFRDGLGSSIVRKGDGFFCMDCEEMHTADQLMFTSLTPEEGDDEFMVSGLDTRFVHRDEDEDIWMYFSGDEEAEGHDGWIFGPDVETILRKARTGGFTWLDMTGIEIPDEGKNLCHKDEMLNFHLSGTDRAVEPEVEKRETSPITDSFARIAVALEEIAETLKKTSEEF